MIRAHTDRRHGTAVCVQPRLSASPKIRRGVAGVFCVWLVAAISVPCRAQASKPLTWGADAEGGAPYEFQDPRDPSRLLGFEVDIADAIGRILGRPMQFVQNQWDGLIPGLESAR
jgi:ABC-type amino acid transport substrate-binding protein